MARQGKSYWRENPVERKHPEGHPYYWLGGIDATFSEDKESDIALLQQGYVTAVPINLGQLTCDHSFTNHRIPFEAHFSDSL